MVKSSGTARVVKKMIIDQFVFVPCCQILFFTGNSVLENPSGQPQAALEKLRGCLPTSLAVPIFSLMVFALDELCCLASVAADKLPICTIKLPSALLERGAFLLEYFPLSYGESKRKVKALLSSLLANKQTNKRTINQSINQPANQPTSQPIDQPNELIIEPTMALSC